ncbi:hypothetical protein [Pilimelia columellifera]|uniref:Uncharacterized protein n=1 Tax=Pilimelia columellifera subsp. columellifera TaxID=706583 RepID=A0ABN3N2C2_9ACTN
MVRWLGTSGELAGPGGRAGADHGEKGMPFGAFAVESSNPFRSVNPTCVVAGVVADGRSAHGGLAVGVAGRAGGACGSWGAWAANRGVVGSSVCHRGAAEVAGWLNGGRTSVRSGDGNGGSSVGSKVAGSSSGRR